MADGELLRAAPVPFAVAPSAPLYSNLGTDAGAFLLNGGLNASGTRYTSLVCNRVILSQPGPQQITAYSVVLHNENAAAFTPATTSITFYDDSGANGGPGLRLLNKAGVYLGGGNFTGPALPAQGKYQLNAAATGYTAAYVPAPTASYVPKVWACVSFSGTNAQATQLANVGLQKYTNAPTVGSTTDLAFVSTVGVSSPVDNPSGTLVAGTGAANVFGWELTTLGSTTLLDSYQVRNAAGTVGTAGFSLNPSTGVEKNFSGYAATIDVPPLTAGKWNVTGLVLYPSCAVANYTSVQATIQLWDTFNGSAAADVFGNTAPIASQTVDLGAFNCTSATSVYQFPVRLPTPMSIGRSGQLGITVKYSADSGAGLVDGAFMEVIQNAPVASPLIAVGGNASTGGTGWYKSASNRADLNFNGATDYVTGTLQHTTLRVYADMVAPTRVVTVSTSGPGTGTVSPGTGNVFDGATASYKLTPTAGNHVVAVTGTCPGTLSGSTFTTAPITADCTVNAVFAPGVGTNGLYQSPAMNHALLNNTNGSTLNLISGAWDDTGPSSGNWDVNFWGSSGKLAFFGINGFQLVLSGTNGALLQSGDVVGSASTFGSGGTPAAGWLAGADGYIGFRFTCNGRLGNPVPGVCYGYAHLTTTGPNGFPATLVDYTYDGDGNPVTIGTAVRTLTSSIGTGSGLIDPLGAKTVTDGGTITYTLYPNAGFHVGTIGGTCPAGTLTGNSYTTGAITANCTVIANFAPDLTAPTIAKAFAPASVAVNVNSVATITLTNPNTSAITLSADLVDSLPTGLTVSGTATTTCGGSGVISNTTTSVKLASGATIPASGSCTITASMQSATAGSYVNTIAAGALQTNAGNNAAAASATLTVTAVVLNPPTIAKAFAPASVAVNVNSVATITLTNPNTSAITLSADLVDTVPTGLVVSAATTTCTGGTASFTAGSFKLASGATIPASGSCKLTGTMQSATVGSYVNTIAAGALQTNAGNNAAAATATLTVTAAAFPAPYCNRTFTSGAEPITRVKISDINNTSPATTTGALSLENFTAIIGQLAPGGTYSIATEGNSDGNFPNVYRVYFDWNHDNVFTEGPGERYEIGTITNSTGTDGKQAVANVLVPTTALTGPTRMRVVKKYSTAGSACGGDDASGTSFGQAEDYTVNVDPANPLPPAIPTLSKAFAPTNADVSASTTLTISLGQINATGASMTLTAALVDTFPTGMTIATTPNASTTCPSGTVTAVAGSGSVTLSTGAKIPPTGCTVKVNVKAASAGIYVNTIAANTLQTDGGNYAGTVSATYQATSPGVVNYSVGFETPDYTVGNLTTQQNWYGSVAADWKVATTNPAVGMQHVRGTWTSAGSGTSYMLSPTLPNGTTDYSVASAKLAITVVSTGATWDFAPQDPSAGSVITRVRFLKGAGNKIQALDPDAPGAGSDGYVDTGSTWTGGGAYFDLKVIAKRSDNTYKVCLNGTQIYASTGFAGNIANVAIIGNKGTGTQNNLLDVDNVVIDNTNDGGCMPSATHTVTPSVGTPSGTISPATVQTVNHGATTSFTLAPAGGFHVANVGGTCGGSLAGNVYTTNAVNADCTVIANFAADSSTHVVTPSVGTGTGTISPSTPQTVNHGATTSFTLAAGAGFHVGTMGGTCGGSLAGNVYTTNAVNADCTVIANFAADTTNNGIITSAPINHLIAATTVGTSLNIVSSATDDSGPTSGNWDFNFWSSSNKLTLWKINSTNGGQYALEAAGGKAKLFQPGDVIGPSTTFSTGTGASVAVADGWLAGTTSGYLGVKFNCSGRLTNPVAAPGVCYGYVRIQTTGPNGFPATILDTVFDGDGNAITIAGGSGPPTVAKSFTPASVAVNVASTATITLANPNATAATLSAALVDTLPTGLVASTATTTCGGTASFTAGSVTLASGATIPPNGSCTISATVKAAAVGNYVNTIAVGALQTSAGNNALAASATLTVTDGSDIVCSAPGINVTIPQTVDGLYINWVTGQTSPTEFSGFHFDPYLGGGKLLFFWNSSAAPDNAGVATTTTGPYKVLAVGDTIGAASTFAQIANGSQNETAAFTAGVTGYLGVRFKNPNTNQVNYGYARLQTTAPNGFPAQILDYCYNKAGASITITGGGGSGAPTVTKAFTPSSVLINTNSTATITLGNPNPTAATLTAALVDTLPSGLVASAATTTCGGTASFTAGSVTLASGATIPANGSCTITATVQSATAGSYVNTIAAGALQTSAGSNALAASATLTVTTSNPFPAPYCGMTFPGGGSGGVEPITRVKFSGIDNVSSATVNGSPALEDFLSVTGGTVLRGGTYSMAVEGNTDGNFTTKVKVFIDWNHNGVFDADEGYVIGDIANSTGTDGKQAVADITVPATALMGATRMRVTKKFNAAAVPCETAGYGQGEDYTLTVNGDMGPPIASVTPNNFTFTAEQGTSKTGTMTVSNSGQGRLDFSIQRALAERAQALVAAKSDAERRVNDALKMAQSGEVMDLGGDLSLKQAGRIGAPVELLATQIAQMSNNTPVTPNGISCGSNTNGTTSDNSWWRRFYFNEHPSVGATAKINAVTVASESGPSVPVKINVYTIPHSVAVDTIPTAQLTLIGTGTGTVGGDLTTSTIPVSSGTVVNDTAGTDLVVEYHIDGSTGRFFPGGNATAQTHKSFISSAACSIGQPSTTDSIGFSDFHIIMMVDVEDAGAPGVGCDAPSNVPWLSTNPTSGTINGVGSKDVTVKADTNGLAVGTHTALLCVNTNDAAHPRFEIPVTLSVTPAGPVDAIFKDGFDGTGGGGTFTQPLKDPSFEATTDDAGSNPFWAGTDSNDPTGGTPFYSASGFDIDVHSGDWEAWFGGWRATAETQTFSQTVTLVSGGPRFINYWRNVVAAPVGTATLKVYVDSTVVATTDIVANGVDAGWTNVSVDISNKADDAPHLIKFEYKTAGSDDGNVFIDDVTIDDHAGTSATRH